MSSLERAEHLPAGVSIPGRARPPLDAVSFANCVTESELPMRFIFGRLVPGSFTRLPGGFRARYTSAYLGATLVAENDKLRLEVMVERADPVYNVWHDWIMDSSQRFLYQLAVTKPNLCR